MQAVVELLKRAQGRIRDPKHWIQGNYARMSKQSKLAVLADDPSATCWCAEGSLRAEGDSGPMYFLALESLERAARDVAMELWPNFGIQLHSPIVNLNDSKPPRIAHKLVMRMYDRAIELAGREP